MGGFHKFKKLFEAGEHIHFGAWLLDQSLKMAGVSGLGALASLVIGWSKNLTALDRAMHALASGAVGLVLAVVLASLWFFFRRSRTPVVGPEDEPARYEAKPDPDSLLPLESAARIALAKTETFPYGQFVVHKVKPNEILRWYAIAILRDEANRPGVFGRRPQSPNVLRIENLQPGEIVDDGRSVKPHHTDQISFTDLAIKWRDLDASIEMFQRVSWKDLGVTDH